MKTTTPLLLAFAALATASLLPRDNSTSVSSSPPVTTTYALSSTQICLQDCTPGDVNCEAACIGSAHPNSLQVSETNECAAQCPQGNGTLSESDGYASCLQACISSYYPTSQTVGVAGASGSGAVASNSATATGTGTGGSVATGTAAKNSGSSATGTAATTSTSKAAATNMVPLLGSARSLAGLFMALLAL